MLLRDTFGGLEEVLLVRELRRKGLEGPWSGPSFLGLCLGGVLAPLGRVTCPDAFRALGTAEGSS